MNGSLAIPTPDQVFVNGRFYSKARFTGTQRSSHNLIASLAAALNGTRLDLFVARENPTWQCLEKFASVTVHSIPTKLTLLLHLWEQLIFPLTARNHLCLNCVGTAPFLLGVRRQIMVVHDINYLLLPDLFSAPYRFWALFAKKLAARRARKIICFSHHVKQTLVNHLRINPEKIAVIYQGPGLDASLLYPAPDISTKGRYFICVGSLQPHKNLARILHAWEKIQSAHPDYQLKIIGTAQRNFKNGDSGLGASENLHVECTGYVSDQTLAELYRNANGLIYPSLAEGFGLPVVEAFHLGCPVITSNLSCLPEIAGDAALLVDPCSVEAIASAILELIREPQTRTDLVRRGLERRKLFSWENAGRQLCAEIEKLHD